MLRMRAVHADAWSSWPSVSSCESARTALMASAFAFNWLCAATSSMAFSKSSLGSLPSTVRQPTPANSSIASRSSGDSTSALAIAL